MANSDAAKPEPTMEEILSSIQKIISADDDDTPAEGVETAEKTEDTRGGAPRENKADRDSGSVEEVALKLKAAEDEAAPLPVPGAGAEKPKSNLLGGLETLVATGLSRLGDRRAKKQAKQEAAVADQAAKTQAEPEEPSAAKIPPPERDIVFQSIDQEPAEDVLLLKDPVKPTGGNEAVSPSAGPPRQPAPVYVPPLPASTPNLGLAAFSGDDMVAREALENLIRRSLEPVLAKWIDDHLETIVERVVREELHKLAPKPAPKSQSATKFPTGRI